MWWRAKAYECPLCGWQGMAEPAPPLDSATCPECGERLTRRSWADTWGRTLLILGLVVVAVLVAGFVGRR